MESSKEFQSESRLTFLEATGIIVGHGVGAGILSVPYLASRNTWWDFIWIVILAFALNLLMHLMIAELSYNHGGKQFVKCLEETIFKGKVRKGATIITFIFLGFSVIMNCSAYITGSVAALSGLTGLSGIGFSILWTFVYYIIVGLVVFFGMKIVGICEKYSTMIMALVMLILFIATMTVEKNPFPTTFQSAKNIFALYGMISFSLSAVMSVPQVVKGLNGDKKKIVGSITCGMGITVSLVILLTLMTILGCGNVTQNGAIVDLSGSLGGWVGVVGYVFTLFALSTSFWANTLDLRDVITEQTTLNRRTSWLIASAPPLVIAIVAIWFASFTKLTAIASVVQMITGLMIIVAYGYSRRENIELKKTEPNVEIAPLIGNFGLLPFQIMIVISSFVASIGSILQSITGID